MMRLSLCAFALLVLVGCAMHVRMRALPAQELRVPVIATTTNLVLPRLGNVASGTLADGTPVWITRTMENEVAVVAPIHATPNRDRVVVAAFRAQAFHFTDYRLIWDVRGRVLGVEGGAVCMIPGTCPRPGFPQLARDLDTFRVQRLDAEHIQVGERVPGAEREITETIFPPREYSEATPEAFPNVPLRSVESAIIDREGQMVLVDGDIVFADGDAPRICNRGRGFGSAIQPCPEGSPRIYDLDSAPADVSVHHRPGPVFVRRFRDGFVQAIVRAGTS